MSMSYDANFASFTWNNDIEVIKSTFTVNIAPAVLYEQSLYDIVLFYSRGSDLPSPLSMQTCGHIGTL